MNQERIEIKLSRGKMGLAFLGSVAFVLTSIWLNGYADKQDRFNPIVVTGVGYLGIVFFGACGLYIFYKLFDTKPGIVIDNEGIYDNSSAAAGHLIKWEQIKGIRIKKIMSTKFLLIDLENPEQFISSAKGIKKRLMSSTYKMYGTPTSIASTSLNCNFDELFRMIGERLQNKSSTSV